MSVMPQTDSGRFPVLALLYGSSIFQLTTIVGFVSLIVLVFLSNATRSDHNRQDTILREPPTYPLGIPIIGHVLSMAWDAPGFLSSVTWVSEPIVYAA